MKKALFAAALGILSFFSVKAQHLAANRFAMLGGYALNYTSKSSVDNFTGAGCSNWAINFDGTDDYVLADNIASPASSYTIEVWLKVNVVQNSSIVVATDNSGPNSDFSHQLRINNGKFEHYTYDGGTHTVTGTT